MELYSLKIELLLILVRNYGFIASDPDKNR